MGKPSQGLDVHRRGVFDFKIAYVSRAFSVSVFSTGQFESTGFRHITGKARLAPGVHFCFDICQASWAQDFHKLARFIPMRE